MVKKVVPAVINSRIAKIGKSKASGTNRFVNRRPVNSDVIKFKGKGRNRVLAMLAPGPSILEVDIARFGGVDGLDTMTINKPDLRLWPTTYWSFCDHSQYIRNKEVFNNYTGVIFNSRAVTASHPSQVIIGACSKFSFDLADGYEIGMSTTYASMQIALYMDYARVYVYGVDMCRVSIGGKSVLHSYGVNPDVKEEVREQRFKRESEYYDKAVGLMGTLKSRFYFCSAYNPFGFVNKYNRVDHRGSEGLVLDAVRELGWQK